jgi:hypothetical protein
MEKCTLAQVPGTTSRFVVLDTERDEGYTIEGSLQVKLPKNSKPGAELEVLFVTDHVWPNDPEWDGTGEQPSRIRARKQREQRDELEAEAARSREAQERAQRTAG